VTTWQFIGDGPNISILNVGLGPVVGGASQIAYGGWHKIHEGATTTAI